MKESTIYISDDGLEFKTPEEATIQDAVCRLVKEIRDPDSDFPFCREGSGPWDGQDYELARWILKERGGLVAELIGIIDRLTVALNDKVLHPGRGLGR